VPVWQRVQQQCRCIKLKGRPETGKKVDPQCTVNAQTRRKVHYSYLKIRHLNVACLQRIELENGD